MSTTIAKNYQVGSDGTATNNFTIRQPATPDGTVRIANGNSGTTTDLVTVTSAGNVGVGTSSPGGTLHLVASSANFLMNQYSADSLGSAAALAKSRGTIASPSAVLTGDSLALFSGGGYNTSSIVYNKAAVQMYAAENWTTTANGSYMTFATTAIGATVRAEAMRITSAGEVGIGTSSPGARLNVNGAYRQGAPTAASIFEWTVNPGAVDFYKLAVVGGVDNLIVANTSGNLGVGTSSPEAGGRLTLDRASFNQLFMKVNGTTELRFYADAALSSIASDTNPLLFEVNGAERARIDSSGNFLAGTTSPINASHTFSRNNSGNNSIVAVNTSTGAPYGVQSRFTGVDPNNTSSYYFEAWNAVSGAYRFYVASNGGIYNFSANNSNLSDRREKTNFAPAKDYLDAICAIPVQTFNYIDQNMEEDAGLTLGVVAQDVQAVAPELVTESNWGTKEDPKMRLSIYQTDLQYALMKCIQELKAELDSVKTELALLKGTA